MSQIMKPYVRKAASTHWLYTGLLFGLVCCALPSYSSNRSEETLTKAFHLSGFEKQIDSLTPMLLATIPVDMFPDWRTRNKIQVDLEKSLGKDFVRPIVYQAVLEDYNDSYIHDVVEFYDSKIGRKVGRLNSSALRPEILRNTREAMHVARHLTPSRRKILEHIIVVEKTTESTRRLLKTLVNGLIEGTLRSNGDRGNEVMQAQLKTLEKNVMLAAKRSDQMVLSAFAHTYSVLSEDELSQLAKYCNSEAANWFRERVQKGINRAVFQVGISLGEITSGLNSRTRDTAGPRGPTAQGRVRNVP